MKLKINGNKAVAIAVLAALVLASAAGIAYLKASETRSLPLPPCWFHAITGLWCTGCGVTRALRLLLEGHVWAAFRMNPLAVVFLPFAAVLAVYMLIKLYRGQSLPSLPTWLPWTIVAVIIVYTVARNLPWEPFSWLAPTEIPWVR